MSELNLEAALEVIAQSEWIPRDKKLLGDTLRALCGKKEEKTYSIGDRFLHDSSDNMNRWILACVADADKVLLINVDTGARFGHRVVVAHETQITESEMVCICQNRRCEFTRIEKP